MRIVVSLVTILALLSCSNPDRKAAVKNRSDTTTPVKRDAIYIGTNDNWQSGFGLTHDPNIDSIWYQPVKFYLDDPLCSGLASDFFYGFLRPSDNGATDELLRLATTDNSKLRPFYRWCLYKTIEIADGALWEHLGEPARRYAEKFPVEFFQYTEEDSSGNRYDRWTAAISYSGFYKNEDWRRNDELINNMMKRMKSNCKGCKPEMQNKIEEFAKDCFGLPPASK